MNSPTEIIPEEPDEILVKSLADVIYQERLLQAKNEEIRQDFLEWKAQEESRRLAKISRWIISAWELAKIIAGLKEGQMVCVDRDGQIYKGRINPEKLVKTRQIFPGRKPVNLDGGEIEYKSLISKSVAEPVINSGFKKSWSTQVKKAAKDSSAMGIFYFFMEIFDKELEENPENIFVEITKNKHGETRVISSIKGISTKLVTNERGRLVGFFGADGKYTSAY